MYNESNYFGTFILVENSKQIVKLNKKEKTDKRNI